MRRRTGLVFWLLLGLLPGAPVLAQTPASSGAASPGAALSGSDPWKALGFLEGTWDAKAQSSNGAAVSGSYVFRFELDHHILARHSHTADCAGPSTYDCEHGDLLYVYQERPGQPLKAIYLDSEGHVLHYDVTTPDATSAVFLTEPSPGPQFRLTYELKGSVMAGRFQMQAPGQASWQTYLEWSGAKK